VVGDDRGRNRNRLEVLVGEEVLETGGRSRRRVARPVAGETAVVGVAEPGERGVGQVVEVAGEVRAPVAETGDANADRSAAHRAVIV
jgi:hypothetical protein